MRPRAGHNTIFKKIPVVGQYALSVSPTQMPSHVHHVVSVA